MAVAGDDVWKLGAFSRISPLEHIQQQAEESDDRRRRYGQPLSVWDGLPISFKANIAVKSMPLTAGSKILGEMTTISANDDENENIHAMKVPPCGYDADVVRILIGDKGAVCIGITNMDEFGMGSLGTHLPRSDDSQSNPRFTRNPLPLLQYLSWEDAFLKTSGAGADINFKSEEDFLADIISLPHDAILEVHQLALERRTLAEEGAATHIYSAGGSSCGSACSVAHGSSVVSLGTDTGGSVRLPAAWCGLVGLKPSYGLLSRFGIVSYASSFDTVGILANDVESATTALDTLAQRSGAEASSRDPTSSFYSFITENEHDNQNCSSPSGSPAIAAAKRLASQEEQPSKPLDGIRVGIPTSFVYDEYADDVMENWSRSAEWLQQNGADIVEISTEDLSLDLVQLALSSYYVLVSAEASSNLSRYDGFRYGVAVESSSIPVEDYSHFTPLEKQFAANRSNGFGVEVSRRILCGTSVLSSDRFHSHYEAAAKIRFALSNELNALFHDGKIDLLMMPTVASTIPQRIDQGSIIDNTAVLATDVLTVPASLAGLPAISIPVPKNDTCGFRTGMQLIGPRLREDLIFVAAGVIESMGGKFTVTE